MQQMNGVGGVQQINGVQQQVGDGAQQINGGGVLQQVGDGAA